MTVNGWIQIALYSVVIIALDEAGRLLSDACFFGRTDFPFAHPAAG